MLTLARPFERETSDVAEQAADDGNEESHL
jgi:hypothetical protein